LSLSIYVADLDGQKEKASTFGGLLLFTYPKSNAQRAWPTPDPRKALDHLTEE